MICSGCINTVVNVIDGNRALYERVVKVVCSVVGVGLHMHEKIFKKSWFLFKKKNRNMLESGTSSKSYKSRNKNERQEKV